MQLHNNIGENWTLHEEMLSIDVVLCNGDIHECLLYIVVSYNQQLMFGHLLNCRRLVPVVICEL